MTLDRRLNAFRPDLAERSLEGIVPAPRFVDGRPARVGVAVAGLRPRPDPASGIDTQLLFGEEVQVLDKATGWAWVKSALDGYVGYVEASALNDQVKSASHIVIQPRSFAYAEPDMKRPVRQALSMGSRLTAIDTVETRGTHYLLLDDGASIIASHCRRLDAPGSQDANEDYVATAARLIETPYLWGGRSAFGIDCSGLVQLSLQMAGRTVMRDSDMQAARLGTPIEAEEARRGDLLFWKGHVAILEGADMLVHANGYTMSVARETITDAIARIRPSYGEPTGWRRV